MLLCMRKAILILSSVILAASPMVFAQDQPLSLGEIARKYRADKERREAAASQPATPPVQPAPAPAVKPDVNSIPDRPPINYVKPTVKVERVAVTDSAAHQDSQQTNVPEKAAGKSGYWARVEAEEKATVFPSVPEPGSAPVLRTRPAAVSRVSTPEPRMEKNHAPNFAPAIPDRPVLVTRPPARPSVGPVSKADQGSGMDEIYQSVGQNLQTPEGEKYSGQFAWEFALKSSRGVQECLGTGKKDPGPFDVVVQLDGEGRAQQAMLFPDTGVSSCLNRRMSNVSFSAPPQPGYWVKVTLTNR
jgi:hypothetical protein